MNSSRAEGKQSDTTAASTRAAPQAGSMEPELYTRSPPVAQSSQRNMQKSLQER